MKKKNITRTKTPKKVKKEKKMTQTNTHTDTKKNHNDERSKDSSDRKIHSKDSDSRDTVRADQYELESHDSYKAPKLGFGPDDSVSESQLDLSNLSTEQRNEVKAQFKNGDISYDQAKALNSKYPGIVKKGIVPNDGRTEFDTTSSNIGPMYLRDTWRDFAQGRVTDAHRNLVRTHCKNLGMTEANFDFLCARDPQNIQLLAQLI